MNYAKKLNLHRFCTQNHILEPFSVRRAYTKSYVTSEPYPRASQIWCQNVRGTRKKKVIKCRGESFARCRVIARNVEGAPPPSLIRVKLPDKLQPYGLYVYYVVHICEFGMLRVNPNLPGGGGGIMAPPCRFFNGASIPLKISRSSFMTFSPRVSRTFWYQIYPGGTYGTTFMVQ